MTFEIGVAILMCIFMPMVMYAVARIAQVVHTHSQMWELQEKENQLNKQLFEQYMPQGVTLQQIKSELGDHLQQHAARDMRQAGTLNYPNLMEPTDESELDTPLETE